MSITQSELKSILHYDPKTGIFTRTKTTSHNAKNGRVLTSISTSGYYCIRIKNKLFYLHRLSFLYITGCLPKDQVDHIDGNKTNNKFVNLRLVSRAENNKNKSLPKNNKSGRVGVYFSKTRKKWVAQIKINHKTRYLGIFTDIKDAIKNRKEAEIKYGFHVNHGRPTL